MVEKGDRTLTRFGHQLEKGLSHNGPVETTFLISRFRRCSQQDPCDCRRQPQGISITAILYVEYVLFGSGYIFQFAGKLIIALPDWWLGALGGVR